MGIHSHPGLNKVCGTFLCAGTDQATKILVGLLQQMDAISIAFATCHDALLVGDTHHSCWGPQKRRSVIKAEASFRQSSASDSLRCVLHSYEEDGEEDAAPEPSPALHDAPTPGTAAQPAAAAAAAPQEPELSAEEEFYDDDDGTALKSCLPAAVCAPATPA